MKDPTLAALDATLESRANSIPARGYLGMSSIGRECTRALWYGFRLATPAQFTAQTLKRFNSGHRGEAVMGKALKDVPGITLYTEDMHGKQWGCADFGGHFSGHLDGVVLGLKHDPARWHVWEHKQVTEKKFNKLADMAEAPGASGYALQSWDSVYYAQAVLYMAYNNLDRHWLTCSTPGERETCAIVTEANPEAAQALRDKALSIIQSQVPPARISEDPEWFECQWCDHSETCRTTPPMPTCRTCCYATPELDGNARWSCRKLGRDLTIDEQRNGGQCPYHIYIPNVLHWRVKDWDPVTGVISYDHPDGSTVNNGPGAWASREIYANPNILTDPVAGQLKSLFQAEVVG